MKIVLDPWRDAINDPPKKIGIYLVERMNSHAKANPQLHLERFDYQMDFETRFSQEFDQDVTIKKTSEQPKFHEFGDTFAASYMEIPGETYEEF